VTIIYITSAAIIALAAFGIWADIYWYRDEGGKDD
jgi:hypothetical protein